ncbi:glycosyltransferase family 59 protein [Hypoxylon sp. CI-4A]|nr:glycosyltransferase family 59 protein [Hypoxylon sp. CI-4A]
MASSPELEPSFTLQLIRYGLIPIITYLFALRWVGNHGDPHVGSKIFLSLTAIGVLSRKWLSIVTDHVPEPYLDEVFHIPQAQVYCDGRYDWDDKITTPPGLYVLTILANKLSGVPCSAYYLRLFNQEVISYLALIAIIARIRFEQPQTGGDPRFPRQYSTYAIWTGINIALFPVLFFFSGLYYTDVISTFVVLLAYANHLGRVDQDKTSWTNDIYTVFLGLLALFMRQTNIFWVVVYMGGLEAVRGVKTLRPKDVTTPAFTTLSQQLKFYAWRYSIGDIHDPPLNRTFPIDLVFCAISIGIAAICNIPTIVRQRIWPHLLMLGAFIGFVAWNGGVVLGDKSNHVATLHLAQMLYIWPLFAFFSAPLFLLPLVTPSMYYMHYLRSLASPKKTSQHNQSAPLKLFHQLGSAHAIHSILVVVAALAVAALIVKSNTLIHPFTLADNRHYMFYVFRHTILKARWIRYALVPVYVLCAWLCWSTLQGSQFSAQSRQEWAQTPLIEKTAGSKPQSGSGWDGPGAYAISPTESIPPSASTVLILFLATALSLVTAPLVEPRYFIVPWVFWRLLVPARPWVLPRLSWEARIPRWLLPLLETVWFLLINAVTMYIFVTRPFYWRTPDGELADEGRVQRFMW